MSTRSAIGVEIGGGEIFAATVTREGDLDGVGTTLALFYPDRRTVERLVSLGDLSTLASEIGDEPHDFSDPPFDVCNAYGRDRGDTDRDPRRYQGREEWIVQATGVEFFYLFSTEDDWIVSTGRGNVWKRLVEELESLEDAGAAWDRE